MKQGSDPTPAHCSSHFFRPGFFISSTCRGSAQRLCSCCQHSQITAVNAPAKRLSFSHRRRALQGIWSGLWGLEIDV